MKCSGTINSSAIWLKVEENRQLCSFLFVELRRWRSQLLPGRRCLGHPRLGYRWINQAMFLKSSLSNSIVALKFKFLIIFMQHLALKVLKGKFPLICIVIVMDVWLACLAVGREDVGSNPRSTLIFFIIVSSLARAKKLFCILFRYPAEKGLLLSNESLISFSNTHLPHKFNVPYCNASLLSMITILLLRAGIESNPGPLPPDLFPDMIVKSQNCRGLTDCRKTINLLKRLYPSKVSVSSSPTVISCLQETHVINNFALSQFFKGTAIIDNGERNQKGVCVLIPEGLRVLESRVSGIGRWAIAAVSASKDSTLCMLVASIYAPNGHREARMFFQDLFQALDDFSDEMAAKSFEVHQAVAGDFNCVLDYATGSQNRAYSPAERDLAVLIKDMMSDRSLCEADKSNSQNNSFTWRRGLCCSKLDYIFLTPLLHTNVTECNTRWYEHGHSYDHACVGVKIASVQKAERGRSFPKLFCSDISAETDKVWIKEQLEKISAECLPHWNPLLRLDYTKSMLRVKVLELRKMKTRTCSSDTIKDKINAISANPILTRSEIDNIESLRVELARAEETEAEILRIKAGVKWRENGEKSTKYFLGRFKARTVAATMNLLRAGRQVITGTKNLLTFVQIFYRQLYNSPAPPRLADERFVEAFLSLCPRLEFEDRRTLANPLDIAELKSSLQSCSDSSPGLDGIPYSFYKLFPDQLLPLVLDAWKYSLQTGELAMSHRQSCVTLLPKKGKDLSVLGNWRPISLSACDLKIITKAYANRLKLVLPKVLSESQAAYVPGRDISFNNRLLNHAKAYIRRQAEDFCVVSLDAKKAFDSVDHRYLERVLAAYDFPPEFIKVFKTLYSNLESVVQVNGSISTPFKISNGVKQGDALSCGLFVLAIDPLIRNLTANDHVEGLLLPVNTYESVEVKVLAYADDVTIVCRNGNLQPIFTEYERLSKVSGLHLNADKTEILNLKESYNQLSRVMYMGLNYEIGRANKIKICGMTIAKDEEQEYVENVVSRISIMESIVTSWGRRHLTINGRMLLAKSFLLSQIVFPSQYVTILSKDIKKIERLIYSFVNGSRRLYGPEQISRKYIKADRQHGGLNGVDVSSFISALAFRQFGKASKLNRNLNLLQSSLNAQRDDITNSVLLKLKANYSLFARSHPIPDLQQISLLSSFPLNVFLSASSEAASNANRYNLSDMFSIQVALQGGAIPRQRINGILRRIPVYYSRLIRAGVLVNVPANFVFVTPTEELDIGVATTKLLKRCLLEQQHPNLSVNIQKIYNQPDLPSSDSLEYKEMCDRIWGIKHPTLRAVRQKVLFKNIYSNERRFRFGLATSPLCTVCNLTETVEHQLLECSNATRLWNMFHSLSGVKVDSIKMLLCGAPTVETELLKATIIKALIQINRSSTLPINVIAKECAFFLRVEAIMNSKNEHKLRQLASQLNVFS